jgi:hypothetical protein
MKPSLKMESFGSAACGHADRYFSECGDPTQRRGQQDVSSHVPVEVDILVLLVNNSGRFKLGRISLLYSI